MFTLNIYIYSRDRSIFWESWPKDKKNHHGNKKHIIKRFGSIGIHLQ